MALHYISHLKPSINLSCISYYLIQSSKPIMAEIQAWQDQNKHVIVSKCQEQLFQKNIFIFIIKPISQMHAHVNAWLTLLHHNTHASMHGRMNACSWRSKEIIEGKSYSNMLRTNKHTCKVIKTYKHRTRQDRNMLNKRNKETEAKKIELEFLGTNMCAHT